MGKKFGNAADPLLLSVRSGARASMPGMMDTILNLGLNDEAVRGPGRQGRQRALRLGLVPPLRADVRRRGHGPEAGVEGRPRPLRGGDRDGQGKAGRAARHRARHRRPEGTGGALQGADPRAHRPRLPHRPLGAAVGRGGGGVRELEQRPRPRLPRAERHPAELGHGGQRAGHGLRQPGRQQRHRRGLHRATPAPAKTCSTASSWSTRRARTWWPASARRSRCRWWARAAGPNWRWSARRSAAPSIRRWKS